LAQAYDGTPKSVSVVTNPASLTVKVTYDGNTAAPTYPGSYAVVATINDPSYQGTANGTLVIATTAVVRHAPVLNGGIDGSLQVILPENTALNGSALLGGDLLVSGTPVVQLNGHPVYAGPVDASGSSSPSNYQITLNGNAAIRHVVRRVDAIALPVVAAPPAPAGTRSVSLNSPGQSPGDFATLRNLTLNSNAGLVTVPAGTYGTFTVNGNSGLILGVPGATQPAVYNLQGLTVNSNSQVEIVGPVIINLANGVSLNSSVGDANHPEWLVLNFAAGGLTLNGNVSCSGYVTAPAGTVTINGNSTLTGGVVSDGLAINGNGLLQVEDPE
jgi:rhamnogalacturonan endolyase